MLPELSPRYIAGRLRSVQHSETIRLVADARTFAPRTASSCKQAMAMALTHGAFDDDFFSGFPLSALMHGNPRGHDGTPGNRGIPLDVKEVSVETGILRETPPPTRWLCTIAEACLALVCRICKGPSYIPPSQVLNSPWC